MRGEGQSSQEGPKEGGKCIHPFHAPAPSLIPLLLWLAQFPST